MDTREELLRKIGQLEYQLLQIDALFREFMQRGDCSIMCTEDAHVCALRIMHNFVKRLRQRVVNKIESLQAEIDQEQLQST